MGEQTQNLTKSWLLEIMVAIIGFGTAAWMSFIFMELRAIRVEVENKSTQIAVMSERQESMSKTVDEIKTDVRQLRTPQKKLGRITELDLQP